MLNWEASKIDCSIPAATVSTYQNEWWSGISVSEEIEPAAGNRKL
jgi:hypothetical protein